MNNKVIFNSIENELNDSSENELNDSSENELNDSSENELNDSSENELNDSSENDSFDNKLYINFDESVLNIKVFNPNYKITYDEFKDLYPNITKLDCKFPEEIRLTTHTIIFKFPLFFNTKHIADYIPMSPNFIVAIKYGNSKDYYGTIIKGKQKRSVTVNTVKKSKTRKNFYFQTTLIIKTNNMNIKIKLFRNGTIQATGGKSISFVFWVIYKLLSYFYEFKQNIYAEPFYNCSLSNLSDFKIVMINCTFNIGFEINKDNTLKFIQNNSNILQNCNIQYIHYDPLRHPAIILKFNVKNKQLTLMLFESGKVILSGATNYSDIIIIYKAFMNMILINHKEIEKISYE